MTSPSSPEESSTPTNKVGRFAHIDALRALSVLMVVVSHAGLTYVPGGGGVTIFFAISGFIITYMLVRERDRTGGFSYQRFYRRRFLKLAPPLLVAIVVPTLVWWALGGHLGVGSFLGQLLFVYNWVHIHNNGAGVLPGSPVTWSLAIEEQFYIVFAIVWMWVVASRARWQRRLLVVGVLAVAIGTVSRLVLALSTPHLAGPPSMTEGLDRIYYGTDTRLDGIGWGVLAALALVRSERGSAAAARVVGAFSSDLALVLAGVVFVGSLAVWDPLVWNTARYTLQSLAACVAILYGFRERGSRLKSVVMAVAGHPAVQLVGLASYSVYLVHYPLMQGLDRLVSLALPEQVVVYVALALAAGIAVYLLVEVPVRRWEHRRTAVPARPLADRLRAN